MNLLLVEDHAVLAHLTVTLLRAKGHQVEHVTNGSDALAAMKSKMPEVALIDLGLPGMTGYELAEVLRSDPRYDAVVLVALSGYASERDRERCLDAGFDAHYAKPMDFSLLETVKRRMGEDRAGRREAALKDAADE